MLIKCAASQVTKIPVCYLVHHLHGYSSKEISPNGLDVLENGLFAVNKPKHLSSAEVVDIIKSVLLPAISDHDRDFFKVGHGGVLDRTASGVLVLGVGRGCKLLHKFLHGVKEYIVTGQLGVATNTYNETGEVTNELTYGHVNKEGFIKVLDKFRGQIIQTPPVYSALKLRGRRYSDLAKEGIEVTPKPRLVKCYSLVCTSFNPPLFSLIVKCGGGFYIRSLIHDLGIEVGSCAHVQELHRAQHGVFKEQEAIARDQWNLEHIKQSIQKAKRTHMQLFKQSPLKYVKSDGNKKNENTEHEKSIIFRDDMFDL